MVVPIIRTRYLRIISLMTIFLMFGFSSKCFAEAGKKNGILGYGLAAISSHDSESALLFKRELLREAKEAKFTEPAHSMKIKQTLAMFRGYYYLKINALYPNLFSGDERSTIVDWFVRITERTFTIEWSDIYYALAFWKPITAPYRNQENGAGALVIFYEIIKDRRPDLARKAADYVRNNAVMWKRNFRNTDDSISYQALWIYNCYNVAKVLYPEWLSNTFSKRSFDWLKSQWPPDGSPLGYNPNPDELVPDIMYLGAYLQKDGTYQWLGDRMMEYALAHNKELGGFRPGFALKSNSVVPIKPAIGSLYIEAPGNLVQFPSENKPDKIVFREGWDLDNFYALLNLRFDGWHGYKGTNSFISVRYGRPFVVEDLVKKSWEWLPEGRAKRRDKNMCRTRFNGFQLKGSFLRTILNKIFGFEDSWHQDVPKFAEVEDFITSPKIDASITRISNWHHWNNTRICLLVKDDYFAVFDFNSGKNRKHHAICWHLRGNLSRKGNMLSLKQADHELSLFLCSDNGDLIIKSSKEPYPPQARDFEPDYDVRMDSISDYSEMICLFWPQRKNSVLQVKKLEEPNPHIMSLNIKTEHFQDTIVVRDENSNEIIRCQGLVSDSRLVVMRESARKTVVYYRGGSFIAFHDQEFDIKDEVGELIVSGVEANDVSL